MTPNHLFNQTKETQDAEEAHRAEKNNQNINVDITTNQPTLNHELAASQPSATYQVLERIAAKNNASRKTLRSDKNIVDALLDEANVGVMHGSAFGLGPYLRISYAVSPSDIDAACYALKRFAHSLRD